MRKCSFCNAAISAEDMTCPACGETTGVGLGGAERAYALTEAGEIEEAEKIYALLAAEDRRCIAYQVGLVRARSENYSRFDGKGTAEAVGFLRVALMFASGNTEDLLSDPEVVPPACSEFLQGYDNYRKEREVRDMSVLTELLRKYGL